jgi:hypothetical protein
VDVAGTQGRTPAIRPAQRHHRRPRETPETCVVLLMTQRSQVQILPPLPSSEAVPRTEGRPLACSLLTDLLTRLLLLRHPACRPGYPGSFVCTSTTYSDGAAGAVSHSQPRYRTDVLTSTHCTVSLSKAPLKITGTF